MSMIESQVLAAGATAATSASFALDATVGQTVVGQISNLTTVCQGFWCDFTPQSIVAGLQVLYRFTFGQMGIATTLLVALALIATRDAYDWTIKLWAQPRSR